MDRFNVLDKIKTDWNNKDLTLAEKVFSISDLFHSSGIDLASVSAFLKVTPAEFDAFLSLGELDDEIIEAISEVDPPKTTWAMFGNADDAEIKQALEAMKQSGKKLYNDTSNYTLSEYIYNKMVEVSGPSIEQKVSQLTGSDIRHAYKKGSDFNQLNDWSSRFLRDISSQKMRGKTLNTKQLNKLIEVLQHLKDKGVITRGSIDGDQDICDRILDALEE